MSMVKLDRQTRALENTFVYHQEDHRDRDAADIWPLCVALSGEVGTPSAAVAREIGRALGWRVHDEDILQRIAADLGISVATLENFDERRRSWLLECFESLSSRPSVGEYVYVRRLVRELRGLAADGQCVIVGRGAPQVLPADGATPQEEPS